MKEPLPPPLPPGKRTVGQLVAESVRFYRHHFWQTLPLGLSVAVVTQLSIALSGGGERPVGFQPLGSGDAVDVAIRLANNAADIADGGRGTLLGGGVVTTALLGSIFMTASFIAASILVSGIKADRYSVLTAFAAGALVFLPAPLLALLFVLPAVAWLALVGLVVPVAVIEGTDFRATFGRATRLGRADYVHALGGLATLLIVYYITRLMLLFLLRSAGESTERIAAFLADLVLSPILFVGAALLYFDQKARLGSRSQAERSRDAHVSDAVHADRPGSADAAVES